MRYIQCDYVIDGDAFSHFGVVNEAEFMALYNARVEDSEDGHLEIN